MPAVASSIADLFADAGPTMSASEIGRRIGMSRQAIADWARDGRLPRPVPGPWSWPRWRTAEIVAHLKKLESAAERRS